MIKLKLALPADGQKEPALVVMMQSGMVILVCGPIEARII